MKTLIAALLASTSFAAPSASPKVFNVVVDERGYTPAEIKVPAGSTVELKLTRTTPDTCATEIVIPSMHVNEKLPLNKTVTVTLKDLKKGTVKFGCHMDLMLSGAVVVE